MNSSRLAMVRRGVGAGILSVCCCLSVQPAGAQQPMPLNLLPQPVTAVAGQGDFRLTSSFTVRVAGADSPQMDAAVLRMLRRMEDKTGLRLARSLSTADTSAATVEVASAGAPVPQFGEDESYRLTVTSGSVHLQAPTTQGAMHGLETLFQLVQPAAGGYVLPAVTIDDAPRFKWRGLMIDCGRHFEPMEVLKRNLDAMAAVKLNVFHWHLTDDQGFRIESKRFPKLTAQGSDGLFYTQEDARELVRYAAARGIRVMPEFEMPGHSTAWLVAYPELSSGSVPTGIRREFGVSDYVLDPTREETYRFLSAFLGEMVTIFPDHYVHIGGDESPAPDWKTNPRILAFMKAHSLKDNDALQAYFNQRVSRILTGLDRRMVGWDEVLNPQLPKDVVIQSWRGEASLAKAAEDGYSGVLSAPYYLDGMRPAETYYLADPVPAGTPLTAAQQKFILGGEVCMWAEHLDAHTIDSRIWPRTAAVAERFWSPQGSRDVDSMYLRLDSVSIELERLGLRHLTSEDAGLRDLTGTDRISPLHTFAQAFEPVSFGTRSQIQKTDQLTPLTSFVDAVVPDPPIRHRLAEATRTFLTAPAANVAASRFLLEYYGAIASSLPAVQMEIDAVPRLADMRTRAAQLGPLMQTGLDAVHFLSTNGGAPAGWKAARMAEIEAAEKPSGLVNFLFLPELTELVQAVKEKSAEAQHGQ